MIGQHTPAMQSALGSLLGVHNKLAELIKELALERFGEEVTNHFTSRAILHGELLAVDTVGNE